MKSVFVLSILFFCGNAARAEMIGFFHFVPTAQSAEACRQAKLAGDVRIIISSNKRLAQLKFAGLTLDVSRERENIYSATKLRGKVREVIIADLEHNTLRYRYSSAKKKLSCDGNFVIAE